MEKLKQRLLCVLFGHFYKTTYSPVMGIPVIKEVCRNCDRKRYGGFIKRLKHSKVPAILQNP